MKKLFSALLIALVSFQLFAKDITAPEDLPTYYAAMDNKSGDNLWSALNSIVLTGFSTLGYDGLWTAYKTTDINEDGNIWDMYGGCSFTYSSDQCGNYNVECDCYNREHSIPKSWFGGTTSGCGCDIFHLVPTDGKVNGMRSNYAFGEVASASYSYNGSQLGTSVASIPVDKATITTAAGGSVSASGKVFEPIDEYKGDFARGYFGTLVHWYSSYSFTSGDGATMFTCSNSASSLNNYGLTAYGIALLMKWHREDPVSQKEIDRNNGIQATQGNRNPFIDYPYLAEYIWGEHHGETVDMDQLLGSFENEFIPDESDGSRESVNPTLRVSSNAIVFDPILANNSTTLTFTLTGSNLTSAINLATSGTGFSCSPSSITAGNANGRHTISVTFAPTATGNYNGSITISSTDASNVVVTLSGTCAEQRTITWNVNGSTYTTGNPTTTVANNGKPTVLPTVPASCDATSTTFVGWSKTNLTSKTNTKPTDLFATAEDAPRITANTTFYAVFAKEDGNGTTNSSVTISELGYGDQEAIEEITIGACSATFAKGSGSNPPKYFNSGTAIRAYGGNTITISGTDISGITFTFGSGDNSNEISANCGTYSNSGTWSGNANSVVFTIGGTSGHRRIAGISITCGGGISHSEYISVCGEQPVCTLSDISLNTTNVTTTFTQGDEFSSEGLVVTANYSDCESHTVTPTSITGYSTSIVGQRSVTVSYTENGITRSAIYNITITEPAPTPTYTITWKVNGESYTTGNPTTEVEEGTALTALPTAPASCDETSTTFIGWSASNITEKTSTAPADLFSTAEDAPSITSNTTFYAVFRSGGSNEKVTTLSSGDNIIIYHPTSGMALTATANGAKLAGITTVIENNSITTLGDGAVKLTVEISAGNYRFKNGNNYLICPATGNGLSFSQTTDYADWTFEENAGIQYLKNVNALYSSKAQYLEYYNGFTTYGGNSFGDAYTFEFYKFEDVEYTTLLNCETCTLTGISLNTTNVATTFTQGDEFSSDGLVVTANYSDCESKVVTPTSITGYDMSVVGQQTITVSYAENGTIESATYSITINAPAPTPTYTITWSVDGTTTPITYDEGDELALPSTPDNCANGKLFVGWTEQSDYADESTAPADLFTVASGTVTANKTYYAVYATVEEGEGGGSSNTTLTMSDLADVSGTLNDFTISTDQASGATPPFYNSTGYDLRIYAKGTLTISSETTMTAINFTISTQGKKRLAPITVDNGSITVNATPTCSWSGSAKSVTFTVGAKADYGTENTKAGQLCFTAINITTAGGVTTTSDYSTICSAEPTSYNINLNQSAGGTISAQATATVGETITLTATPNAHYAFGSWEVLDATGATVNVTNNQFVMPASDVTVSATFNVIQYNISTTLTNVTAEITNPTSASVLDDDIMFYFESSTGYVLPNDISVKIGENTLVKDEDYIWDVDGDAAILEILQENGITNDLYITITAIAKQYDILFVDDDETTELASIKVNHGETPVYPNSTPTKEATAQYTYSFSNWTPAIVAATDDEIYTAVYTPTLREYDIEISLATSDENGTVAITRGEKEKYNYNDNIEITATPKAGYTFVHWNDNVTTNPRVISVDGSAIVLTAYFEPSANVGYKVNYYQENIKDNNYTKVDSTNKLGTTGAIARIDTLLYEGFELASVEDKTIDGDGSTVVNVYYNRQKCNVTTYYFDYKLDKQNRRYRVYTAVQYKYGQNAYTIPPIGDMSDSCYIYRPIGWSPELPTIVTSSSEHYALYDSIPQKYTLSWNANEGVLTGEYTNGTTAYATAIVAPTATREGYVFEGWLPNTPTTMPAKDITYVAQWTAAGTTPYVVNHYQQNLENDDYTLIEAENKQGAADASITPLTKEYTGFDAPSTQTTTIASNGSTVVNYYYNRHVYRIEFRHNPALQSHALLQADSLRYGAAVAFTGEAPTYSSGCQYEYTFTGWSPEITSVVGDQVYDAQFEKELKERRVTFRYNSTFYQIDTLFYGDMPSYRGETPTKNATVQYTYTFAGWEPEISVINCSRNVYDYNAKFDQALRKYTVTFYDADSTSVLETQEVEYGKAASTPQKIPTKLGYEFSGWGTVYDYITGNISIYPVMIKSGNIPYIVKHFQQNVENDEFTLVESDTLNGEMDAQITPAVKTYTGFDSPTPQTTTIAGDGSTVVEYQYTRKYYIVDFNYFSGRQHSSYKYGSMPQFDEQEVPIPNATDKYSFSFSHWEPAIHAVTEEQQYQAVYDTLLRSYVVRFYDSDSTTLLSSETYDWGTSNIPMPTTMTVPVGYRFSYWSSNIDAFWTSTSRVTGETNIYPQFVLQQYVIRVYNSEIGSVEYVGQKDVYHYGDIVTITANAVEGYHFAQWSDGNTQNPRTIIVGSSEFDSNNALDLTMQFAANTDTKYVVKHSLQNTNGEGYFLFQCDTLYGESGSFVRPDGLDTIGFITPSLNAVRIAADGSTVIELYYDRMTYKYQYRDYNSEQIGNIVEVLYGNEPEAPEVPAREGYTFTGWKVYEVIGVLTILDATYKQNETTALSDNTQDELLYYVANSCLYIENVPANSVVRIYDMSGRSLMTQQNCTGDITLQLPRINGMYVMSITTDNQTKSYKIVK